MINWGIMSLSIARKAYFESAIPSASSPGGRGANFTLEVFLTGVLDERSGLLVNLIDVEDVLKGFTAKVDKRHLREDLQLFQQKDFNLSEFAQYCLSEIEPKLKRDSSSLEKLRLSIENEDEWVELSVNS